MKRIFLIVLDSFGVGAMPDSQSFGDVGVNTLASCATSDKLHIPNMIAAGLGNMDGVTCLPKVENPTGAFCRLSERSMGKDTTIGHWEIAGLVSENPLPTYPEGFPEEVLAPFRAATGRGVLANAPWSGTAVLDEFGEEHMRTGDLIVYTSADSVFQIAAHEDIVPPEQLYEYCRIARKILTGNMAVFIQFFQRNNLLMGSNLEHGVGGGIDDQITGLHMLLAEFFDDRCAGPGSVGQNAAAGGFAEGLQHLFREALGIGGQRVGRYNTGDLPVTDGGIFAHGLFRQTGYHTGGGIGLGQVSNTVGVTQARRDHIGDMQFSRGCAGAECVHISVTKLLCIGHGTNAAGIKHK
jgi:hypothetical protein